MLYADSNVFLYAYLDEGELGEKARSKLKAARDGAGLCTSSLTWDEVMWSMQKAGRHRKDVEVAGRKFLRLDRMKLLPVQRSDLETAVDLYRDGLDPRDAIHVAVAMNHGCDAVLSNDGDLGRAKGIKHQPLR